MMKTFNCGVGFCLILPKKNVEKNNQIFSKEKYLPYEIGKIVNSPKKINLLRFLKMVKKNACIFISGKVQI